MPGVGASVEVRVYKTKQSTKQGIGSNAYDCISCKLPFIHLRNCFVPCDQESLKSVKHSLCLIVTL